MRVLALFLKEEVERTVKGKKRIVKCMPGTDRAICKALEQKGHSVTRMPYSPEKGLDVDKGDYDVVFNLCDGLEGDNGFVEFKALRDIERTGIPFTGNSLHTVRLCNDKRNIKHALVRAGIRTPNYQVLKSAGQKLRSDMRFPLIVKPVCADAAVGIYEDSVVYDVKNLRRCVKRVLVEHEQSAALVSEYIAGRDLVIPVLGKKKIEVLYPSELKYMRSFENKPKILSYGAKWHEGKPIYKDCITLIKNPEKRFTKDELALISSTARRVYRAVGCFGYATVDARLDKKGDVFVIEVNPNCWIGPKSDTALCLKKNYGLCFADMVDRIVKISLE